MTTEDADRLIASLRRINTVVTVDAADLLRATLADLAASDALAEARNTGMNELLARAEAAEAALVAERGARERIEGALRGLVSRLDAIHDDPAYQSVWTVSQLHVGPYRGPTYVAELATARAALAGKTEGG